MDSEKLQDDLSPNSPPSSENIGPEYISSYTQISHYDNQTDIDSSDIDEEFETDNKNPDKLAIPELSSQIAEWSKKTLQSYDNTKDDATESSESTKELDNKLEYFEMKLLNDLETQAVTIAQNLNEIMNYIKNFSNNTTSSTVEVMKFYHDNVFDTCDSIDSNIKLMYKIICKCEELNKSFNVIDDLREKIKEIKNSLDNFDRIIL